MSKRSEDKLQFGNFYTPLFKKSLIVGSLAGASETLINHPFWSLKTRQQCGYPFSLNPLILYRGLGSSLFFMVPIITTRMTVRDILQSYYPLNSNDTYQEIRQIFPAFCGGVASSLITNPSQVAMTYQQRFGGTFFNALKSINYKSSKGLPLFAGFLGTTMQDGIFTSGFLAGTSIVKGKLKSHFHNEYILSLVSGSSVGVAAALLSQPFETIKTLQHNSAVHGTKASPIEMSKTIYQKDGLFGLYKGGFYRCSRVVSSVTILSFATEKLTTNLKI